MQEGKFIVTGTCIGSLNNYNQGVNTYIKNKNLFSSISGTITLSKANQLDNKYTINVVSNIQNKSVSLSIDSIIIGKVIKIKEDYVNVKILKVNDENIKQNLEGMIRKQNIRESEIDKIQMEHCFIPGDIVRAKIVSLGDSHKLYLSTIGDEFGVLYAKCQETQQMMLPYSWEEMICIQSGLKEKRKVAKPNMQQFNQKQ